MPAMPRPQTKAKKIAYKILGIPQNIAFKRSPEQKYVNKRLMFEETARVK